MKHHSGSSINNEVRRRTRRRDHSYEGRSSKSDGPSRRRKPTERPRPGIEMDCSFTPWLDLLPARDYDGVEHRLHHEILAYVNYMGPIPREKKARELALTCVRRVVHGRFRNAKVDVFGSYATGLSLPTSDIDVAVTIPSVLDKKEALFQLSSGLRSSGLTRSRIFVNHRARVPILTLTTREEYGSFKMDIGINNPLGLEGMEITKAYLAKMPALRPLVLVTKGFILQRGLNDAAKGGLGSFPLICLCIGFLQMNPGKRPQEFIDKPMETGSLGALLADFFFYYGFEFPYETSYLSISEGKLLPKEEPSNSISIRSPIDPETDISRSLRKVESLIQAFKEGYATVLQLTAVEEALLGKLVGLSYTTVRQRALVRSDIPDYGVIPRPRYSFHENSYSRPPRSRENSWVHHYIPSDGPGPGPGPGLGY